MNLLMNLSAVSCRLENIDEFDCLVGGFMALKRSGTQDLFTVLPEEVSTHQSRKQIVLYKIVILR